MTKRLPWFQLPGLVLVGLVFCWPNIPKTLAAGAIPVEALVSLPAISRPRLSPDGEHIAVLVPIGGRHRLAIQRWGDTDQAPLILESLPATYIKQFLWLNAERLLVRQDFLTRRYGGSHIETRFIAINKDGSRMKVLHRDFIQVYGSRKIRDYLVDVLPEDPKHILLAETTGKSSYPSVIQIDVDDGSRKTVVRSRRKIDDWLTDQDGVVRLGVSHRSLGKRIYWRRGEGKKWRQAAKFSSGKGQIFSPLAFGPGAERIYVLSNHESDRQAAYEFDLKTGSFGRRLFSHPRVDAAGVILSVDETKPLGVLYIVDRPQVHYLDPDFEAEMARVKASTPGAMSNFASRSLDGRRAIIFSDDTTRAGEYFLWDRERNTLKPLGKRYPALEGAKLAVMEPISYKARDGLDIPGYLTLPVDVKPELLPLVVVPHGGPISRKSQTFDYWAQFLASRGYAVLQPNIRGSSGFGRAHLAAGYRQWGLAMQDDITDGVQWLIDRGLVDRDRICIVGASFGGYAALMGAVRTPDLYKCVVSVAGLSDLPLGISYGQNYMYSAVHSMTRGKTWVDGRRLAMTSPARRVKAFKTPVMLVHGDQDKIVPVIHSQLMARGLERAGKPFELLILKDGDHHLSLGKNRLIFLQKLEAFLARHLGPNTVAGK